MLLCVGAQVWDPRVRRGEGLAVRACSSHTDWISAVVWHPSSGGLGEWQYAWLGAVAICCWAEAGDATRPVASGRWQASPCHSLLCLMLLPLRVFIYFKPLPLLAAVVQPTMC